MDADNPAGLAAPAVVSASEGGILPADQVFLNLPATEALALPASPHLPGPGPGEALLWMAGVWAAQIVAMAGMAALLGVVYVASQAPQPNAVPNAQAIATFFEVHLLWLMAAGGAGIALYGLAGVVQRHRPHALGKLGLRAPRPGHALLILIAAVPLSLVCSEFARVLVHWFPRSDLRMGETLQRVADGPFVFVLLTIAVLPSLGEELVFRGLIGRGLLARRGLWGGMALSSVLFGVVHLIPAQGLPVMVLGFAMHYAYYTTRSFWSGVLVHLLNNAWAVVLLKCSADWPPRLQEILAMEKHVPLELVAVSIAQLAGVGMLLWQTRARYILPGGEEWSPGYATAGPPPPSAGALRQTGPPGFGLLLWNAAWAAAFCALLYRSAMQVG